MAKQKQLEKDYYDKAKAQYKEELGKEMSTGELKQLALESNRKARENEQWAEEAAKYAANLLVRVQCVDKVYRRIKKTDRCFKEKRDGLDPYALGCAGVCIMPGGPGARMWSCARRSGGEKPPCLCADLNLPGYAPDAWDWLGLDMRTCADHYTRDATSKGIRAYTEKIDNEPAVEDTGGGAGAGEGDEATGVKKREKLLMTTALLTRTKDVIFDGNAGSSWSFWEEAAAAVYPFNREALKAVVKKAWEEGEKTGKRQRILNPPLVGPAYSNAERKSAATEEGMGETEDRDARWRLARQTYNKALINPLEEIWDERQKLLEAGEQTVWEPFLRLVKELTGYGELTSGVFADHLRLTSFWTSPALRRCRVTGARLVEDKDEYCYFGDTGATRGLGLVLGLSKQCEADLTKAEKLEWMRRICAVQRRLSPVSILGELQPEVELRDTEYGLCEVQKPENPSRHSYPVCHLKRAHNFKRKAVVEEAEGALAKKREICCNANQEDKERHEAGEGEVAAEERVAEKEREEDETGRNLQGPTTRSRARAAAAKAAAPERQEKGRQCEPRESSPVRPKTAGREEAPEITARRIRDSLGDMVEPPKKRQYRTGAEAFPKSKGSFPNALEPELREELERLRRKAALLTESIKQARKTKDSQSETMRAERLRKVCAMAWSLRDRVAERTGKARKSADAVKKEVALLLEEIDLMEREDKTSDAVHLATVRQHALNIKDYNNETLGHLVPDEAEEDVCREIVFHEAEAQNM